MTDSSLEDKTHWSEEKEAIKTNKPLKLVLFLLKVMPSPIPHALCYFIAFFYLIFSKNARQFAALYQKQLKEFTNGKVPRRISPYKQILSFALCLEEKMEGWLGKIPYDRVRLQNDDMENLLNRLREGKSAFVISSHLGNLELMRSLQEEMSNLCGRKIEVTIIMDMSMSKNFGNTLKEINPNYSLNVIDSSSFGPESMILILDQVEKGSLLVVTGDRTSVNSRDKVIVKKFLNRDAKFPYGIFLIPALIKEPVYYMFGMRERLSIFNPKYNMHMEKSAVDFDCPRTEREAKINECCGEYVEKLEKYCTKYPYQWYNFFNFWS